MAPAATLSGVLLHRTTARVSRVATAPYRALAQAAASLHFLTHRPRHPARLASYAARNESTGSTKEPVRQAYRADRPDLPFSELGITGVAEKVGGVRVRQHSNPLKAEFQIPAQPLDWAATYEDSTQPLVLDIGSGYGRFLLMLDRRQPKKYNHLGLELRAPIVRRANLWAKELGQSSSVYFTNANGTVSVDSILSSYPGELQLVTIQFPDPHFKKRHHKRRIVQPRLVDAIAKNLSPGGKVFLQSDVEEVAAAMRANFEKHGAGRFEVAAEHLEGQTFSCSLPPETNEDVQQDTWTSQWVSHGWMAENPLGVPTEREVYTQESGLPVYRVLLVRV
mmetsp:Transcript_15948/g.44534  ORF Transcript_15948/g.44534 Transcript_15948/m.44534 type:complete len:336 (-) Transcript_15948:24-1031(-)